MIYTPVYDRTMEAICKTDRFVSSCGGTRSGKTFANLQAIYEIAIQDKVPTLTSVVSETFPHLKRGAIRDFPLAIGEYWDETRWSKGGFVYTLPNGSQIEFFSADSPAKVHGPARDRLFLNEIQNIPYEIARQLFVRTKGLIIMDYNPVARFWGNELIETRPDCITIHSTYRDNTLLSSNQVAEIESYKQDKNWWRVYGEGLVGQLDNLIFPDWEYTDEMPEGCKVRYGLDFGFNDPTALIKIGVLGHDLFLDEQLYQKGIITAEISAKMAALGIKKRQDKIIGDCANAEQVETLYRDGWNIHPSKKGAGSIVAGIDLMKRYRIKVTKRSTNLQTELMNYTWERDKNDNLLNKPIDAFCHLLDAARYALADLSANSGGYSLTWA